MEMQLIGAPETSHVPVAGLLAQDALFLRNASEVPVSASAAVTYLALDSHVSGEGTVLRADSGACDSGSCGCCCCCCCCDSGSCACQA